MINPEISERIRTSSTVNPLTGCWEWNLCCDPDGYGRIHVGKPQRAHRLSFSCFKGEIPDGLTIDHLCRNRRCVNPEHLEAVTRRENTLRGEGATAKNARKVTCCAGHPLSGSNVYLYHGSRFCRECNRVSVRAYKARITARTEVAA